MIKKDDDFDLQILWRSTVGRQYAFAFIAFFAFLFIIYSNSFQGSFHFDDVSNIVGNSNIQLNSLDWPDIKRTFYGMDGQKIVRPLAYFSFALNYYFDGLNVFGYHVINFTIHYLASIFLFLFLLNTLKLPSLSDKYGQSAYSIALLTTMFWATSPVQVTAVTYIVQRMASMAGLFYIMAMYFYLKGRTANTHANRLIFFGLTTLTALLSIGTKENAVMIPVSLWVFDLLLIQGVTRENVIKKLKVAVPIILILATIALWYVDVTSILNGAAYKGRTFTLSERLLTEPRVIIFYITLLFYPISSRLTLLHDVEISTSFLTPWTTMPAIACIVFLVFLGFYIARKSPLISFSILFFLLNHLTEGSLVPLELIYEHRNYIPSMLFFVPVAIFLLKVIDHFSYQKSVQRLITALVVFLLFAQGDTAFSRNALFAHPLLLMEDNVKKSPNLSRVHHNLGSVYWTNGAYEKACQSYENALRFNRHINKTDVAVTLHSLGMCRLYAKGDPDSAMAYLQSAIDVDPSYWPSYKDASICLLQKGSIKEAAEKIRTALTMWPNNSELHEAFGLILLKTGKYDQAILEARRAIAVDPRRYSPLTILAEAFRKKGDIGLAVAYWEKFLEKYPDNLQGNFALIELYFVQNNRGKLFRTVEKLTTLKRSRTWDEFMNDDIDKMAPAAFSPDREKLLEIIENAYLKRS